MSQKSFGISVIVLFYRFYCRRHLSLCTRPYLCFIFDLRDTGTMSPFCCLRLCTHDGMAVFPLTSTLRVRRIITCMLSLIPPPGGAYVFEAQWEQLGSGYWREATTIAVDRYLPITIRQAQRLGSNRQHAQGETCSRRKMATVMELLVSLFCKAYPLPCVRPLPHDGWARRLSRTSSSQSFTRFLDCFRRRRMTLCRDLCRDHLERYSYVGLSEPGVLLP